MRYTSSHPHAFRNRIAKSIGVLVAAALVATLGLPGAAQAQAIDPARENHVRGWRWLRGSSWVPNRLHVADDFDLNWKREVEEAGLAS